MRFPALLFIGFSAGALAFACGQDDPKPPTAGVSNDPPPGNGGSQVSNPGSLPGTTDAGQCSGIAIGAIQVAQNGVNDTLPAGTGGTILNGTYDLTTDDKYLGLSGLAGPTGIELTSTIAITDTAFERVETQLSVSNVSSTTNESGTLTLAGVNGVIGLTCPLGTSSSITYTVSTDSTTVTFYDSTTNEGRTYRLR